MLRAERAKLFWFVPQLLTFWGYISWQIKSKNLSNRFVWGRKADGAVAPMPPLSYMHAY